MKEVNPVIIKWKACKGVKSMGQNRQFKPGQKAPNNGAYVEIGETGSTVLNPKKVKLEAGDTFPETSNHNRIWTYQRKP
jgi:hypothetical protein